MYNWFFSYLKGVYRRDGGRPQGCMVKGQEAMATSNKGSSDWTWGKPLSNENTEAWEQVAQTCCGMSVLGEFRKLTRKDPE